MFFRIELGFALLVMSGCYLKYPVSDEFIVVDRGWRSLHAVSADEAHLSYRTFNEDGGDLRFWTQALTNNLVEGRGYVLVSTADVTRHDGHAGRELVFETTVRGRTVRYLVTLFVDVKSKDESRIHVVEYTADKAAFEHHVATVRDSVKRLD